MLDVVKEGSRPHTITRQENQYHTVSVLAVQTSLLAKFHLPILRAVVAFNQIPLCTIIVCVQLPLFFAWFDAPHSITLPVLLQRKASMIAFMGTSRKNDWCLHYTAPTYQPPTLFLQLCSLWPALFLSAVLPWLSYGSRAHRTNIASRQRSCKGRFMLCCRRKVRERNCLDVCFLFFFNLPPWSFWR